MSFFETEELVRLALREDLASAGDVTSRAVIPEDDECEAEIVAKEDWLILAGTEPASVVFSLLDASVRLDFLAHQDGNRLERGEVVCRLAGRTRSVLAGERLALNFLQRLSGIATLTRRCVEAVAPYKAKILDTRKTTPGLRALEKAAVRAGGGENHRFGLYDGVLLKDNHIAAAGGVVEAVLRAKRGVPRGMKTEVEVVDLAGVEAALAAGADMLLLDNMTLDVIARAVRIVAGRVPLEASGGMSLENINEVAACGVDYISMGAITHSAPAADLSLEIIG
ncbi:MAG: carboxylating nicotinate-nucleotide diphosphorylase [Pseudomonadota bacterium]